MNNVLSIYQLSEELRRFMREEILGPFNRWVTGEEVGHDPTSEECAWHYVKNGGVHNFRQDHNIPLAN